MCPIDWSNHFHFSASLRKNLLNNSFRAQTQGLVSPSLTGISWICHWEGNVYSLICQTVCHSVLPCTGSHPDSPTHCTDTTLYKGHLVVNHGNMFQTCSVVSVQQSVILYLHVQGSNPEILSGLFPIQTPPYCHCSGQINWALKAKACRGTTTRSVGTNKETELRSMFQVNYMCLRT